MPNTTFKTATLAFALLAACTLAALPTQPAAAQSGETLTERFITDLERKAIDRYLLRQGVERPERDCLLFPDRYCDDYDLGDLDEEGGQGKQSKSGKKNKAAQGKGKSKQLPPGLAKRKELPPGLAKRSELPPGLAKRDLPHDLSIALPGRGDGTGLYEVDGNLVLMDIATNTVLDIIEGVLRGGN